MGIFSRFWGRAHAETVDHSADRANVRFILPEDTALWAAPSSRRVIREKFEWVRQNFALVAEMVAGVARQTVGKGIVLQLNTSNSDWNFEAERQFEAWALTPERCDAAARRDFYSAQDFAVQQYIGPGEFFSRDVLNPRPDWEGEPCFQLYDPSEIASPKNNQDDTILDGIRLDEHYTASEIFCLTRTPDGSDYLPAPAAEWCHWYRATTVNQVRGVSPFAPAMNRLVGMYELERLTIRSAKAHQLIALVLKGFDKRRSKGALGAISNQGGTGPYDASQDTAAAEKLFQGAGGAIAYVGQEGDAKIVSSTQPSPLVSQFFTDHLLRDIALVPGFPSEWWWKMDALGGPGQRAMLARVDGVVQVLADQLIYKWIRRQAFRVLSHRIKTGKLAQPADPFWMERMSFQTPPRVSIDNGRDTSAIIARMQNGLTTHRDVADMEGRNSKEVTRQWLREPLELLAMAKDMGYTPTMLARLEANLPLWRAPAPGAAAPSPETPDEDAEKTAKPAPAAPLVDNPAGE